MIKAASEYKGVILLFIVLIIMANVINHRVNELNAMEQSTVAYYEK